MRQQLIILSFNHYDMDSNKGFSARVLGELEVTNNSFGVPVTEAKIPNYDELQLVKRFEGQLPAKFNANVSLTRIKGSNGKEMTGIALKNLEFLNSVEFTDKKELAKS